MTQAVVAKGQRQMGLCALVVAGVLTVLLAGCIRPTGGLALASSDSPQRQALPSQGPADDFKMEDQNGQWVQLSQFRGRAVLMTFFYAQCPDGDFCSLINLNLKQVWDALDESSRQELVLLSITLDPIADTPAALKEYAAKQGFDLPGWHFLTGYPETLMEITQAYGIAREETAPRDHAHADGSVHQHGQGIRHMAQALLVDQNGEVRGAYLGAPTGGGRMFSVQDIVTDLTTILGSDGGSH